MSPHLIINYIIINNIITSIFLNTIIVIINESWQMLSPKSSSNTIDDILGGNAQFTSLPAAPEVAQKEGEL